MKEFDKHDFDEIFRNGLSAPDPIEVDEDWELIKAQLQRRKNRTIVPYLIFLSSVAAVLLLVFSVVFNSDETAQNQSSIVDKNNEQTPATRIIGSEDIITESVPEDATNEVTEEFSNKTKAIYYPKRTMDIEPGQTYQSSRSVQLADNTLIIITPDSSSISTLPGQPLTSEPVDSETILASSNSINIESAAESNTVGLAENQKVMNEQSNPSGSRLSLAINLAPDLNGVEHLQSNKISYSIGAGLIYKLTDKLSIEAGAAYGRKSYQTGFSSFKPANYNLFQVKPNIVSSGFDVMDIQLNMAYTLLKRGNSSFGIGAGISSYLMLDEQYSFNYPNIHARGLSSFHTGYQRNHFLGIANLNLSYKRNLTNNLKLAFNPYLKLPLTDLGYGNIRLRSAGVSVGVITNLNKNKK